MVALVHHEVAGVLAESKLGNVILSSCLKKKLLFWGNKNCNPGSDLWVYANYWDGK